MSDSDDDVPLALRRTNGAGVAPSAEASAKPKPKPVAKPAPKKAAAPAAKPKPAAKPAPRKRPAAKPQEDDMDEDEDEDESSEEGSSSEEGDDGEDSDVPLSQRARARSSSEAGPSKQRKRAAENGGATRTVRARRSAGGGDGEGSAPKKKKGSTIMWQTFSHAGVMFPPDYVPHGVKMLYDGKPVDLTPEQEEVASFYATMTGSDYLSKELFVNNFWEGFKKVLGTGHTIKSLEKCDFSPIYEHLNREREAKKNMTKEEKLKLKADKDAAEAKFKTALVDGRPEPVGNFRVEPPGLFRGRGQHPKMGKIKRRIYPRDVTINIGKGEPIPEHPYPGQKWKEVRHDQTVTWLAYWKDTTSDKNYKYVFLAPTSTFKADSDLAKYEKARKLKGLIDTIRKNYEADWESPDLKKRQMAVALYFIDKLALRAGHEKDEDEADTVGCCTLKCENVELIPPNQIKFDFLGKDSIKYENTVEVDKLVYENVKKFRSIDQHGKKKNPDKHLFDSFEANDLNKELRQIMEGLSVKVFRTYNASITLDRLLREQEEFVQGLTFVDAKKAEYDKANKEVAILCNHQRSVPKTHGDAMAKMQAVMDELQNELKELEQDLVLARKGGSKDGKKLDVDVVKRKIEKKKEQIEKKEVAAKSREALSTVALGTSKINYMDPRITIAWCKRNEVPLEKVFNKSLQGKFSWAMEVEPEFVW